MADISKIKYQSICWSLGTTSFRTKQFNRSIETQLILLNRFWNNPSYSNATWEKNETTQAAYYKLMQEKGFVNGDAPRPAKDARQKTSGLVSLGLINSQHRITEAGQKLLEIAENGQYDSNTELMISADSIIYLKQLLKTSVEIERDSVVKPLVVLIHVLSEVGFLSQEEFTYLLPLCSDYNSTRFIIDSIKLCREGHVSMDDVIIGLLMTKENYRKALYYFLSSDVTIDTICFIGMNRKSRDGKQRYDKAYYPLYMAMKRVFVDGNYNYCIDIYKATKDVKIGKWWRQYLFDTTSEKAIKNDPLIHLRKSLFTNVQNERQFKEMFFQIMHLFKAKATLSDYADLNRRYFGITQIFVFEDEQVKLDLVPKQFFASAIDELYQTAYTPSDKLEQDCKMEEICPALKFNKEEVVERINEELGIELETIDEAYSEVEKRRYDRFKTMVDTRFTNDDLLGLLDDFDNRNDNEISKKVTDNAAPPTIFEYILGIIWYKVSGYKGRILDYMKLSLDANLLPITHAAGGEADIVYEYGETKDYPAHTLLLEATLADSTNQRRMEMEPVSRHLGNHLLRTQNMSSYCLFATNYLDKNVISDFRMRKVVPFYDTRDDSRYVTGMKIIPLQTSDLRSIIMTHKKYSELYPKYEKAYQKDMTMLPVYWYETCVKEKTEISSFLQAPEISEFADEIMKIKKGISILGLQQACIEKFGDTYCTMKLGDWYNVVKDYIERQTMRYNLRDDEPVMWQAAEERT